MSKPTKPLGRAGIDKLRQITKDGPGRVNGRLCDCLTASAIVAVWDKLGETQRAKLESCSLTSAATICFKLVEIVPQL